MTSRKTLDDWMAQGEKTWAEKAIEKTKEILAKHRFFKIYSEKPLSATHIQPAPPSSICRSSCRYRSIV